MELHISDNKNRNQIRRSISKGFPSPTNDDFNINLPSPRVPTEIVDHILALALASCSSASLVPEFSSIAAVTLASTDFRQIALRRYFHDITLETRPHWKGLFSVLEMQEYKQAWKGKKEGGFAWVRSLCASSKILSHKPTRLSYLTNLHTLSIDLAQEGLSTQHPRMKTLIKSFEPANISLKLTSLTLSNLPRIDIVLLKLVVSSFPCLMDLYLSCTERLEFSCCWSCFEDSLGCTIHSPIPDDYLDVSDMANAFAGALKPLTFLTHLHLGIFLSDDQLLYAHIAHSLGDEENMGMVDGSGRCSTCFESAVQDVRIRELEASIIMAQKLKAIKSIGWSSFFTGSPRPSNKNEDDEEDADEAACQEVKEGEDMNDEELDNSEIAEDMKTTVWVLKTNGRIRVRRMPW